MHTKTLYIPLFLLSKFGPDYCVPPQHYYKSRGQGFEYPYGMWRFLCAQTTPHQLLLLEPLQRGFVDTIST